MGTYVELVAAASLLQRQSMFVRMFVRKSVVTESTTGSIETSRPQFSESLTQ